MKHIAGGPGQQVYGRYKNHTPQQRKESLTKLKARHDEVVRHEDAHYDTALAHGLKAGRPVLTDWVEGPDGKRYATGGHVMIETGKTGNPELDVKRARGMVEAAEAPLSVDSELSEADKRIAERGRQILAESEPKMNRIKHVKNALADFGGQISAGGMSSLVAGMGLDIPQGQIVNIFGV